MLSTSDIALGSTSSLRVFRGAEALKYLSVDDFQERWLKLLNACPWSTCLQSPSYVLTWYDCYSEFHDPLIVSAEGPRGSLCGLLTLAVQKQTGTLTFAGAHQAEYQVWLALPSEQNFIGDALAKLQDLGFGVLHFAYLPPGTPLEWLAQGKQHWQRTSIVRKLSRPLMQVGDGAEIRNSLRKKSNKSRVNRLEHIGKLEFQQLRTPEELDEIADELIVFTDLRQGAAHGSYPFRGDSKKYLFHRELMRFPDLTHVTTLRVGQKLIAAHVGLINGAQVILGILSHSPFFAEHSPGKLQMLYLGLLLAEQRKSGLDLTPGGDSYKERFATAHDYVYRLTVFLNQKSWLRHRVSTAVLSAGKRLATLLHVNPRTASARLTKITSRVSRAGVGGMIRAVFRRVVEHIWSTAEMRFYRWTIGKLPIGAVRELARMDSLGDLLSYAPGENWYLSKSDFVRAALSRIEKGSHVYTRVEDGILVHYGWLTIGQTEANITEVQHPYRYPLDSATLWDFYTHPRYRGRGFYFNSLRQMIADLETRQDLRFAYIAVLANNRPSRSVIEKFGFEYQESIVRRTRFFTVRFSYPGREDTAVL